MMPTHRMCCGGKSKKAADETTPKAGDDAKTETEAAS